MRRYHVSIQITSPETNTRSFSVEAENFRAALELAESRLGDEVGRIVSIDEAF